MPGWLTANDGGRYFEVLFVKISGELAENTAYFLCEKIASCSKGITGQVLARGVKILHSVEYISVCR